MLSAWAIIISPLAMRTSCSPSILGFVVVNLAWHVVTIGETIRVATKLPSVLAKVEIRA